MKELTKIKEDDDLIKGELADGGGVVTVKNEHWTQTDEENLEGNWEIVTTEILESELNSDGDATEGHFKVEWERVSEILKSSDITSGSTESEQELQASLLLQYLVEEGVYSRDGSEIVILDEFKAVSTAESDKFNRLNWSAFLSLVLERINNSIQVAEGQEEKIADMFQREDIGTSVSEIPEPDSEEATSERELIEDLSHITGVDISDIAHQRNKDQWTPPKKDETGMPFAPDGIDDRWEYAKVWNQLETKQKSRPVSEIGEGESSGEENSEGESSGEENSEEEIRGRINAQIEQMRQYGIEIRDVEPTLRRTTIPAIANLPELRETLQNALVVGNSLFNGASLGEEDVDEVANGIGDMAAGLDFEDVETEGEESEETEVEDDGELVTEETENAVSNSSSSSSSDTDEIFSSEPENN